MCALAALIYLGRLSAATTSMGNDLNLQVVTAVVLGGTSIMGGIGSVTGHLHRRAHHRRPPQGLYAAQFQRQHLQLHARRHAHRRPDRLRPARGTEEDRRENIQVGKERIGNPSRLDLSESKKATFKRALAREALHPVPYSVKFTVEARESFAAYLGRSFDEVDDLGSYVVASHTNGGWTEVRPGFFRDYFGMVWNKSVDRTLGVPSEYRFREPSFGDYRFPDAEDLPVYKTIPANDRRHPEAFHMLSIGFALFERAWSLTGMEELMVWMLTEPAFVHELMDRITSYNIASSTRLPISAASIACISATIGAHSTVP